MTSPESETRDAVLAYNLPEGSRVKVVVLGGIGCALLPPLAVFLRSLGRTLRLVLIDGDRFKPENAGRMAFPRPGNKAEVKASEALQLLSGSAVRSGCGPGLRHAGQRRAPPAPARSRLPLRR